MWYRPIQCLCAINSFLRVLPLSLWSLKITIIFTIAQSECTLLIFLQSQDLSSQPLTSQPLQLSLFHDSSVLRIDYMIFAELWLFQTSSLITKDQIRREMKTFCFVFLNFEIRWCITVWSSDGSGSNLFFTQAG